MRGPPWRRSGRRDPTAHGREEYLAWLGEEIRDSVAIGHRWSQVQYLCAEHAWLFADRCAPAVLATACDHLLAGIAEALRQLQWEIRDSIPRNLSGRLRALPARWQSGREVEDPNQSRPPLTRRIRRALGTLWLTPQKFLANALELRLRWEVCPLCRHLQTVEARALDRLVAVLADPEGLQAFQKSYGLCLRHAPLVLERAADLNLRREIAAVLLARVEVDHWEVDEYLRKTSWSQRHEPKGPEEAAWLRATTRIAGVAMEREYGF
jgi:hypothetical protein